MSISQDISASEADREIEEENKLYSPYQQGGY